MSFEASQFHSPSQSQAKHVLELRMEEVCDLEALREQNDQVIVAGGAEATSLPEISDLPVWLEGGYTLEARGQCFIDCPGILGPTYIAPSRGDRATIGATREGGASPSDARAFTGRVRPSKCTGALRKATGESTRAEKGVQIPLQRRRSLANGNSFGPKQALLRSCWRGRRRARPGAKWKPSKGHLLA